MKSIAVIDEKPFLKAKTAIITMATNSDGYKLMGDETWINAWRNWNAGEHVMEVNHFQRHHTAIGDVIEVHNITGDVVSHIQVLDILMVNGESLSDIQINALGYANREAYMNDWGKALAGKAWYMVIKKLTPQQAYNAVVH